MVSVCLPSDALCQHLPSYLGFSYLGSGVSLHGWSSKAQSLLLTLDEWYLLTAAPPDLAYYLISIYFTSQPIYYLKRCARSIFLLVTVSFTGFWVAIIIYVGFPGCSAGKEYTCNAGDSGSIPGSGRSPGDGNDYPLQYSGLENSMYREAWRATSPWCCKKSDTTECLLYWESPCFLDCKLHEDRAQVVKTLSSLYHWCLAPGNSTC